jgi:hypothetical protein
MMNLQTVDYQLVADKNWIFSAIFALKKMIRFSLYYRDVPFYHAERSESI